MTNLIYLDYICKYHLPLVTTSILEFQAPGMLMTKSSDDMVQP